MSKQITRILCMILTLAMVAAFALVPMASAATATKTIYFDNSINNWSEVAVYTWNDNGPTTGEWPGTVMTKVSGNVYSYEVPTTATKIIFNNNNNGSQTGDMAFPTDAKNLYNGSVWGVYGQAIEVTYILAGSEALCGTNWDPSNTANQLFDKDGDGVYTISYNNVPAYTYEFKVTDGTWNNSWGKDGGSDNYVLMLNADSNVTVNFDAATKLITVDIVPVAGEHVHSYTQSVIAPSCTQSGYTINFCVGCGDSYDSNYTSPLGHKFVNGTCTTCGEVDTGYVPVAQDYYLFGYINGADYGCGDDLANLGAYKFVNNKVTVTFTDDSYVAVKTADNASFYMTNGWVGEATSVTLHKFTDSNAVSANKMLISAGQTVTFTLVDNLNGTLTLSYTVDASTCNHPYHNLDGVCTTCGTAVEHSFSSGVCTGCGLSDGSYNPYTYYLFGYINGADYATDASTLGEYKFVDGKLTVTFNTDSYVGVKEIYPNGKYGPEVIGWYMTDGYLGEVTTATLYRSGDIANPDKLFVPGGVELTFTMSKEGYTIVLSYEKSGCTHSYSESVTNATCTANGSKTFTCTKCGYSYTETIYSTGHSYVDGSCSVCGATDPNAGGVYYSLVGYINGANYGCEEDHANPGSYKFVNGKLTTSFTEDSYIFIKTSDNANWYLATSYTTDSTCNFVIGGSEKMLVPAGVALTFTLVENADGSVTVSYTTAAASTVPTLTLKAPTLEFKDMITVNAMFTAENIQDVVEMGMITYSTKVSSWSVDTAEHVIPGTTYDVNTARYIASSQGIHAKYLGDTVYLAVYAKLSDGTYAYSKLAPYSPVQYATSKLNDTDTSLKQLVAAMLNYGAAAQTHFEHNTGALANASLTAAQKALPAAYNSSMVSSVPTASAAKQGAFANNSGFAKRYPSISFEGAFCINYFFTPNYTPDNGITLYYWNAADYNAASVLTTANASGSFKLNGSGTGEYSGDIEGIAAKALSEAVYVAAVYTNGGTTWTSGVLGYSIGAYCSSQATKGGTIAELAKATAVYGYHAKAYFG